MLHVKMFGNLRISSREDKLQEVIFPAKSGCFLAYFFLNRNRWVSKEELVDIFWNDQSSSNPVSALKTLIHRIRKILDDKLGPADYIIEQNGNYRWNPEIEVEIDTEIFENQLQQIELMRIDNAEKIELYEKATAMYKDDFLNNGTNYYWLELESGYYRSLEIKALSKLILLYKKERNYSRLEEVCEACLKRNMIDEDMYYYLILSKIFLNKRQEAKKAYKKAKKMLKKEYGIEYSAKIESLRQKVMHLENLEHKELESIYDEIEEGSLKGAFECHYVVFKDICRLEYRKMQREKADDSDHVKQRHILLITAQDKNCEIEEEKNYIEKDTMQKIIAVVKNNLRAGDALARCSENQVILLLQGCESRDWLNISQRVILEVRKQFKNIVCDIQYHNLREDGSV